MSTQESSNGRPRAQDRPGSNVLVREIASVGVGSAYHSLRPGARRITTLTAATQAGKRSASIST